MKLNEIKLAITRAEEDIPLKFESRLLSGFSGAKMIRCLQNFCDIFKGRNDLCYLEIGVFQGLTLLSVAGSTNETGFPCYGIDNFNYFDPEKKNLNIVNNRKEKLGLNNAFIINEDYENVLENLDKYLAGRKIGIYFIDGPHDYRSQLMCLLLAKPFLAEDAVIIVDDSNYRHVRQANRDFLISHPEYKLLYESYTPCHPTNMDSTTKKEATQGWWDGVNILIRDKENILKPMYPPTERDRTLYENEHLIHSNRLAIFAPNIVRSFNYLTRGKLIKATRGFGFLIREYLKKKPRGVYNDLNTFSNNLPTRMNE